MILETLCDSLKKVKDFAKERSVYDLSKNVRIIGTEDKLTMYCCDGEIGIWQRQRVYGRPVLGSFCINVFSFLKVLSSLPSDYDIGMTLTEGYNLKIVGPSFKMTLVALPPENAMEMAPHNQWEKLEEGFFETFRLVSSMGIDESFPVTYNGDTIYYATKYIVAYKEAKSSIPPFKISAKTSEKMFIDTFDKIDVTERQIHLRNNDCEIFVPQTVMTSQDIRPILNAIGSSYVNTLDINPTELRNIYETIATLKSVGNIDNNAVDIVVKPSGVTITYLESEFQVDCNNKSKIETLIRIPINHLKAITSTRNAKETDTIKILLSSLQNAMFVADKGYGVMFAGGLSR